MKRIVGSLLGLLFTLVAAGGLYVQSVWSPAIPRDLVQRVQKRTAAHGGYTPLPRIPRFLQLAVIATEDRTFYHNIGIDFIGTSRALFSDIAQGRLAQGGSTISQQLIKDMFLSDQKAMSRKLKQIALAVMLNRVMSKNVILTLYLNEVYLGQGTYGVGEAARVYFGRDVSRLSPAQSALIAGLPQAPSAYDPFVHYALAKARQREVLISMVRAGYLTQAQAKRIANAPLHLLPVTGFAAGLPKT